MKVQVANQAEFTAKELAIALRILRGEQDISALNPRQQAVLIAAMEK